MKAALLLFAQSRSGSIQACAVLPFPHRSFALKRLGPFRSRQAGLRLRARLHRRLRDWLGACHPVVGGEAVPDPVGVNGADARHRPARAGGRISYRFRAIRRSATSSSSTRPTEPSSERWGGASCGRRNAASVSQAGVPQESATDFIKRIVAGPGDRVRERPSGVGRRHDGRKEPFIAVAAVDLVAHATCQADHDPAQNEYFVMGDSDRGASDDSRFGGPVPRSWIIGEAFADLTGLRTEPVSSRSRPASPRLLPHVDPSSSETQRERAVWGQPHAGRRTERTLSRALFVLKAMVPATTVWQMSQGWRRVAQATPLIALLGAFCVLGPGSGDATSSAPAAQQSGSSIILHLPAGKQISEFKVHRDRGVIRRYRVSVASGVGVLSLVHLHSHTAKTIHMPIGTPPAKAFGDICKSHDGSKCIATASRVRCRRRVSGTSGSRSSPNRRPGSRSGSRVVPNKRS